jgi:uncharacterized protein YqeY
VTLSERLQNDLTQAIRDRNELRRDALRMAISAINLSAKTAKRDLSDDEVIGLLQREIKTRRETVESSAAAGRADTAAEEQQKLDIISAYMPEQLSDEELTALVNAAIDESGATSARDMGTVMAAVMPKIKGRAEGKAVSAKVAQELARRDVAGHDSAGHDHAGHGH